MTRTRSITAFLGAAGMVYTAVFLITRTHPARPGTMAGAALCDLLITVPAIFYWLLVRAGFASWIALAGVALTGARAAWVLLPVAMRGYLPAVGWIAVPLELLVVATLLRSGSRLKNSFAGRLILAEFEVFYYALFAWRAKPEAPSGFRAYSCGEASGYRMFCVLLPIVLVMEGLPLHLILQHWSATAAWICTALDAYALLWAIGVARSLTLRPILVGEGSVILRTGMLWSVEASMANIVSVRRFESAAPLDLKLAVMSDPQWVMELAEPAMAYGLYGRRRRVRRIGFSPDDASWIPARLPAILEMHANRDRNR